MAGSRKPGPLGRNPEVQDLNDGTMIRGLSPLPGPVGVSLMTTHGSLTTAPARTSGVDQLLQRLREASNGIDSQRVAVALLGPQCFSAGVIAGIGVDIIGSAADLLKLVGTLVLADLHDVRTGQVSWWRIVDPTIASRLLVATLAGIAFEEELRKAAEERDALVGELTDALQDPQALFEGLAEGVAEGYKKEWQDFNAHLNAGTLERRFRAGMVLGQVLVDVLGLLTGIVGVGRAGVKVATKLPRLVQYARSVKLKPGIRGVPRGGGARGGGGGAPKAPPETQPAAKAARPSPPPAEPPTIKPRVPSKSPTELQLDEMYAKAPSAKAEIDALADSIAKEIGAKPPAKAPLKGRNRVLEKATKDYGGDASRVQDIARNTIVVEDQSQYDKAVTLLKQQGAKIKTHDAASHPMGYSGTNAVVKTKTGLPAEIQVNTPEMIYAKESSANARAILGEEKYAELAAKTGVPGGRGHQLYEEYRSLSAGDPRAADLARESRAYYDHIRQAGGQ